MSQGVAADSAHQPAACPGCSSTHSEPAFSGVGEWSLLGCRRCGLVYTWPDLPPDALARYYSEEYYAHRPAAWTPGRQRLLRSLILQRYFGYPVPEEMRASTWLRLLQPAVSLLAPARAFWRTIPRAVAGGHLLDVGCGSGAYLARVRALGWQVSGVEPSARACSYARERLGLEVYCGTLDEQPFPEASYDVVTFWHSLEHSSHPGRDLQEAYALLRPAGLIMLEVPNWDSLQRRLFRRHWFHLDVPRHRVHFRRDVLRQYLESAGFVDVQITPVPSPVGASGSLEGLLHRPQAAGRRPWRHNPVLKAALWLPEIVLSRAGWAGCLAATARKP